MNAIRSCSGFDFSTVSRKGAGQKGSSASSGFQMPLHYPRLKKNDYETMPEWRLDCLLKEYGLPVVGGVDEKRKFAMGAFLWPSEQ
ncbi:unnamed protein product [Linum tenue]|uniref:DUF7722 domain-containing protein n=2 Tax=Linum tenue TaxID=586396 RepID=A0AAV0M6Y2_9ROSI|nr:unnamed protein product [Linum tenue]